MEFNFRGLDAQMQQMYHTPVKEGLWNGTSLGGGRRVLGILPGSVDSREAIQREIEKEMIREEILAEEIVRKRVLEAEVRREMAMEKAMHGGGFPSSSSSSFMLKPPGMLPPRGQPYGGGSGSQRREIESFQTVPIQRLPSSSSGDGKKKVIDLGKLNGAKTKPAAAGSSEWSCAVCKVSAPCEQGLNAHLAGKKHQAQMATLKSSKARRQKSDGMIKLKNKFGEIGLGVAPKKPATMEPKVLKSKKSTQPPVNKNSSKCVSKKEEKKSEGKGIRQPFSFFCEICQVLASSDKTMNAHIKGKKHLNNLLKLHQESGSGSEAASAASETKKTHDSKEKHKAETEFVEKTQVEEESESVGSVLAVEDQQW